jgi:hypothetical protein
VIVKEGSKLQDSAVRFGCALRDGLRSKKQVNRSSPTVVREGISVSPLVADAEHTGGFYRSDYVGDLLFRFCKD